MHRLSFPIVAVLSSVLLALIFVVVGALFWQQDRRELELGLLRESQTLRTTFEVALSDLEQQMLALATMVASDPEVQALFRRGRETLEAEGGGPGGAQTASLRDALYAQVAPAWSDMQRQFGLRQLHFQFGPGSLSYLRVHTPEKFGDRMDGLRHIIEDVNRDRQPRTGFETGRIYSGVRGVVPVWYEDDAGGREFIGVLEAGTSFDVQLARLDQQIGAGFAVLLRQQHVEHAVWEQYRPLNGPHADVGCGCYLEATSRDEMRAWMGETGLWPLQSDGTFSQLLPWQGQVWHVTRFPLRDYLGMVDPSRPEVGWVLAWRDKTAVIADREQRRIWTAFVLLVAYALTQGLLMWLLYSTRRGLQRRIDDATAALSESEAMLYRAQSVARVGSWQLDATTHRLDWSAETRRIFGVAPDAPVDYALFLSRVHPDDRDEVGAAWKAAMAGASYDIEHRVVVDGETRWVRELAELVLDADGRLLSGLGSVQDITDLKRMELELRRLATTDILTGLPNRRHFLERMEQELARHHRFGETAAVLMIDIDHFKQVNDRHGHAAGDALLRHFAALLTGSLRKSDIAGRLGGEEFAVLLAGSDADGAGLYAERLRQQVAQSACAFGDA
ncbi:MAG: diguanylate cyclase, partial [Chromatiales bacterium]|nr:diguanylate cyclase [Chromatiales bacterium]